METLQIRKEVYGILKKMSKKSSKKDISSGQGKRGRIEKERN